MSHFTLSRRGVMIGMAAATTLPRIGFAQTGTPVQGGTLKISHSTRIATLNVLSNSGPAEYPVMDMVYSGLTRIGVDTRPVPDLAESWTANDDATEFTFHLRHGVTFHDGTPFTADDVVATYELILNPDTPAAARSVLDMVEAIEATDDHTVVFRLSVPYADLPTSTAHTNARIISRAAAEAPLTELDTNVNGTGPFKLEDYDSARITRLVKNDDYFIEGKPYLDAVEMHLFPDLAAETANFLSGDMDVMLTVQQADYERIAGSAGVEAQRVPSGRYVNVVMRYDQAPFDDLRVRQALAMSVDRQLLVDIVLEGLGRPANDNILSPEFHYAVDAPAIPYDPEGARALLAEAGYPDGIDLTLVASNRPAIRVQTAIAIRQMAQPAGFNIEVETMPHDTYLANVWMQGPFYMGYWGMQPTEDGTFNLLLTSDASYEDTGWKNAEFDGLVEQARSTPDEAERAALYTQAQELILRDKPYIIPFFEDVLTASRDETEEWTVAPISRYYYIENVWLDRN
ncbi:ABC transporter substrate-binding protein [Rhodophyticola sp. CCM32]|uniref:ABC transporter substrate-binding protein n=1 Tax=Rhodophyticola sp. CCM32 TaxID=2916397 RepID=UPI00107EF680|nr:ABC transporter substrate-binding protein [Rhodophyticola sp. CCM32]QBY01347.1 ABC transporter substrate-binding protein [Rhodophyticola sp. CCM32]